MLQAFSFRIALRVLSGLITFWISVFVAKALGAEKLGIYTMALSVTGTLSIITRLGIPTLLSRELAKYRQQHDLPRIKGVSRYSHVIVITLSLIILITVKMTLSSGWLVGLWPQYLDYKEPIYISTWSIALAGLCALRVGTLQAFGHVVISDVPDSLIKPISFLIIVLMLRQFGVDDSTERVATYLKMEVISGLIALLSGYFFMNKVGVFQAGIKPKYEFDQWNKSLIPLIILGGAMIFNQNIDTFMLSYYADSKEVGLFRPAVQIYGLCGTLMTLMSGIIAPKFAAFHVNRDYKSINALNLKASLVVLTLTMPVLLFLYLYGEIILIRFYGDDFLKTYKSLTFLLVALFFNMVFGFSSVILTMGNHQQICAYFTTASLVLNTYLNYRFIPLYGSSGAAMATTISQALLSIVLFIVYINQYARNNIDCNTPPRGDI